jgi:hypothetical protein
MKHLLYVRLEKEDGGVIESRSLFVDVLDDGSLRYVTPIGEIMSVIKQRVRAYVLSEERRGIRKKKKEEEQHNE